MSCPATGLVVGTKSPHCGDEISPGETFSFPPLGAAGLGVGVVVASSRVGKGNVFAD